MICALPITSMRDPVTPTVTPDISAPIIAQVQRDLRWIATSPWLVTPDTSVPDGYGVMPQHVDTQSFPPLAQWPLALSPVIEELLGASEGIATHVLATAIPRRLGHYAERLLGTILGNLPGITLLAANLPIRRVNTGKAGIDTLGELDFVWRDDATGRVYHWELATKFYLLAEDGGTSAPVRWMHFVGPNLADRFGDKLHHIATRQLPLSNTPEARAVLGCHVDEAAAYLKGWLFYPLSQPQVRLSPRMPVQLSADHLHGWWGTLEQFSACRHDAQFWCLLPRAQWLATASFVVEHAGWLTHAEMTDMLHRRFSSAADAPAYWRTTPVMVCGLQEWSDATGKTAWQEVTRGFVVPETWPALARQRASGESIALVDG